ncbi:ABC transporter permease [Cognatiyoonia sp. IB215182]|uniref:ABC transporter permease n=1 Tax=Cognatiyoonia sp. IB215182 TaxID=3097353 RepID=UPI002A115124|nr:ABC transporter permease [Cognatiyoonia sp. IB215182]MDX8354313.1 ABC transporter permease [Cognatiyoonia sp. IB215182]
MISTGPAPAGLQHGSTIVGRVHALMLREQRTRFAGSIFGYGWAYFTPIAWIVTIALFFDFLGRTSPLLVPTPIFVATGILPYVLFRQTLTSMMRAPKANRFMVYFRPTSLSETLLASGLLELMNMLIVAFTLLTTISLMYGVAPPDSLFKVVIALLVTWCFAFGFGRFFGICGRLSPTFERVLPILIRPLFWVSGIFYIASELPGPAQSLFWFSPLFHTIEYLREGFFLGFSSPISAIGYPMSLGLGFLLGSIALENYWLRSRPDRGVL